MPDKPEARRALPRPEAVGDLLEGVLADLGLAGKLEGYRAVLAWEEVAGPSLCAHARALRLNRGRLELAVPSGVWRTQLSFSKRQLIERLNLRLGKAVVRDLVFTNRREDGTRRGRVG
ncbi:DUF721 domain-containing protein [Candidatus Latescibacterota bacterium]